MSYELLHSCSTWPPPVFPSCFWGVQEVSQLCAWSCLIMCSSCLPPTCSPLEDTVLPQPLLLPFVTEHCSPPVGLPLLHLKMQHPQGSPGTGSFHVSMWSHTRFHTKTGRMIPLSSSKLEVFTQSLQPEPTKSLKPNSSRKAGSWAVAWYLQSLPASTLVPLPLLSKRQPIWSC